MYSLANDFNPHVFFCSVQRELEEGIYWCLTNSLQDESSTAMVIFMEKLEDR